MIEEATVSMSGIMKEIKELQGELEEELKKKETKCVREDEYGCRNVDAYEIDREIKKILNKLENLVERKNCIKKDSILLNISFIKSYDDNYDNVENLLSELDALSEADFGNTAKKEILHSDKEKVLFISHCSKDFFYVEKMIELLQFIGIKDKSKLFCSSKSGYDIPEGENIYDYLKNLFKEKDIYLVTLLSNNYYKSTACLNEMGAGWLTSCAQTAFLMPGFSFKDIDGAIDPGKIMITLNNKPRLNDFKNKLINVFGLDSIDQNIWEDQRNKIVEEINAHYEGIRTLNTADSLTSIEKHRIKPSGNDVEFLVSFRNEGTTEVACIGLNIELKDINGNSASIFINDEHDSFLGTNLHPDENRFENIKISKDIFETSDGFDFYKLNNSECKIEASWDR